MGDELRIEVVRGRLSDEQRAGVLALWEAHEASGSGDPPPSVDDVVCVVLDASGAVCGASTARERNVVLVGNRRFYSHDRALAPKVGDDADQRLLATSFEALQAESSEASSPPLGVCWRVDDAELMRRNPEAVWPGSGFLYAGYLRDGRQLRIRYFEGASLA